MDILHEAKRVYEIEIEALQSCHQTLGKDFVRLVEEINTCSGRVIITGIGKSGHICKKIAATMASLGIKAFYLHPAEGLHGDLGLITKDDLVIAVSHSGESDEVLGLLPNIRIIGAKVIAIVGRQGSTLSKLAAFTYVFPEMSEACLDNLVPTTSTTATLVLGDALSVAVAKLRGFTKNDFAVFHPHGTLGKRLTLTTGMLMRTGDENAVVRLGSSLKDTILEMCKKPIGGVVVIDRDNQLVGVFTDGDLRRLVSADTKDIMDKRVDRVMTQKPVTGKADKLIIDILPLMRRQNGTLSILPIVDDENTFLGTLCLADIMKSGLI